MQILSKSPSVVNASVGVGNKHSLGKKGSLSSLKAGSGKKGRAASKAITNAAKGKQLGEVVDTSMDGEEEWY